MIELKRRVVDQLVDQFWKQGYLTVSRKFGTYLPDPGKIGNFEVDIIAKQRNNYAIGLILSENDFKNSDLIEKLTYLSTRQTRYTNKKVYLFVGVKTEFYNRAKSLIKLLSPEARKSVRVFQIEDKSSFQKASVEEKQKILFS